MDFLDCSCVFGLTGVPRAIKARNIFLGNIFIFPVRNHIHLSIYGWTTNQRVAHEVLYNSATCILIETWEVTDWICVHTHTGSRKETNNFQRISHSCNPTL